MSFVASCTCGKQYKVADENRGKTSKCKACGAALRLEPDAATALPPPAPAVNEYDGGDGDPFANIDWDAAATMEQNAAVNAGGGPPRLPAGRAGAPPPALPAGPPGSKKKPCPACGSTISAFALKCEFCGANLMAGAGAPVSSPRPNKYLSDSPADDTELVALDWLLCILCFKLGLIAGLVYALQGRPKGWKMVGISLAVPVVLVVVGFVLIHAFMPAQPVQP